MINNHPLKPVFDFLASHSLMDLREQHGVRFHVKGHLVTLAYDQFEAKITNEISNLCRGLVIARKDGSDVVDVSAVFGEVELLAFPMVRFFNYGQGAQEPFKAVSVYEKLDGTMAVVYYDKFNDRFNVATRNVPDGSNATNDGLGSTFRDLFARAIKENYGLSWEAFERRLSVLNTYVFELMTPENIVVVRHTEYKASLLAVRNTVGGFELILDKYNNDFGFELPASYPELVNSDLDAIVKVANDRDPLTNEGFVVAGANFQRLKIKSEKYVTYNKVHDLTKYDALNYLLTGEIDDYLPLMADYQKAMVVDLSEKVAEWAKIANFAFLGLSLMRFDSKKDLALFLNSNPLLKRYGRTIFHMWDLGIGFDKLDAQTLIKDYRDSNTGRYSDSFLRLLMNEWL